MLARMTLAVLPSATSSIFLLEGCVNNSAKIFCFFAKKQIISVMMLPNKLHQIIVARIKLGKSKAAIARGMDIPITTMRYAWKMYQECGHTHDAPRPGQPISEVRRSIKEDIATNVSIRALGREFGVAKATMRMMVKTDMGLEVLGQAQDPAAHATSEEEEAHHVHIIVEQDKGAGMTKPFIFPDKKGVTAF